MFLLNVKNTILSLEDFPKIIKPGIRIAKIQVRGKIPIVLLLKQNYIQYGIHAYVKSNCM